ncbi:hypothetical protein A2U01_0000899 [Trifolium medium]|uniref:Uncharacterized protein n=1 Tax=Trifolium medium TaxID=97028 RepID=A0A392LYS0_9FABA|nr:hypothetical protein [Trifolium medium]
MNMRLSNDAPFIDGGIVPRRFTHWGDKKRKRVMDCPEQAGGGKRQKLSFWVNAEQKKKIDSEKVYSHGRAPTYNTQCF